MTKLLTLPAQRIPKFFVLALALVLVAAVGPFSGKFEDAQENESTSFLPGDAESVKALEAIERFPDGQVAAAVTIIERDGGLRPEDRQAAEGLVRDLTDDPPIITAGTEGPIPSEDGEAAARDHAGARHRRHRRGLPRLGHRHPRARARVARRRP